MIEAQTADVETAQPEKEALQHELADVQRKAKNFGRLGERHCWAQLTNRLAELEQQADTLSYQLSSLESEPKFLFCLQGRSSVLLEQF